MVSCSGVRIGRPISAIPSYRTIGNAVDLCQNTVRKYVRSLEEKGLAYTEPSKITTRDGRVRNGSLIYTIRPIREAVELYHQRQLRHIEEETERARVKKCLEKLEQDKTEEMKERTA